MGVWDMKYKILLTGNNKTIIDDFFSKAGEDFEYQSTSARYEDILSHIKYFFLSCLCQIFSGSNKKK